MTNWEKFLKFQINTEEIDFNFSSIIDSSVIESNTAKIQNALKQAQEIEAGKKVNTDEDRMVGHYWLRNSSLAPNDKIKKEIENEIHKIENFCKNINSNFKNVLFIGIGGSALGPQFLIDSLKSKLNFFFFDNTDPNTFKDVLSRIDLGKTLVTVISKSGGTTETLNAMLETEASFKNKNLDFNSHSVAITCQGSKLDQIATNWLNSFYIWDWVGGRTSIFSAVGLLPLGLAGHNIKEFLQAGSKMDLLCKAKSNNPAMLLALSWLHSKGKNMLVIPYCDRLTLFSRYLQQLVMESIGKEKDFDGKIINEGLNVFGNKGSTDQHALVQQLRDGKNDFFLSFVNVLKTEQGIALDDDKVSSRDHLFGFYLGTKKALSDSQRQSLTINIKDLNHKSLAALIAVYERAVGFYASFLNINAYNQPGVEAGKKAAKEVIELKKKLLDLELFKQGANLEQLSINLKADKVQLYELLNFMALNKEIELLNEYGSNNSSSIDEIIFKSSI